MEYVSRESVRRKIKEYETELVKAEFSANTIKKYISDIKQWMEWTGEGISKENLIEYKNVLGAKYKVATVNSKLISINRFFKWLGYEELIVKVNRQQRKNNLDNVISIENYFKILEYAKQQKKKKMYYIIKTIACTGIRNGELGFITVEAVKKGYVVVFNKGKYRTIYLNPTLCEELMLYCKEYHIENGMLFYGRSRDKVITKEAVWKNLKSFARKTGVPEETAYPHSLRHMFAKRYMEMVGDITELADILGHSRIESTWIYTKTTCTEKRKRLELLGL